MESVVPAHVFTLLTWKENLLQADPNGLVLWTAKFAELSSQYRQNILKKQVLGSADGCARAIPARDARFG